METVSERLSVAVASMAAELDLLRPTARLYSHIYSFTHTEAARMAIAIREKVHRLRMEDLVKGGLGQLHAHQQDQARHDQARDVLHPAVAEGVVGVRLFAPPDGSPAASPPRSPASDRLLKASAVTAMEPLTAVRRRTCPHEQQNIQCDAHSAAQRCRRRGGRRG